MKALPIALVASCLLATPALAASLIDCRWAIDTSSAKITPKSFTTRLAKGVYTCADCKPPFSVPADGAFHAVTGHPYIDEYAVKIIDPRTVELRTRKGGKLTDSERDTVSADGKALTYVDTDTSAPDGKPQVTTGEQVRTAPGEPGSRAVAGAWRTIKFTSNQAQVYTYHVDGKTLSASATGGARFQAVIGGAAAPIVGDPSHATMAVTQSGPRVFVMTVSHAGKPRSRTTLTVAADGKSMEIASMDLQQGVTNRITAIKQ